MDLLTHCTQLMRTGQTQSPARPQWTTSYLWKVAATTTAKSLSAWELSHTEQSIPGLGGGCCHVPAAARSMSGREGSVGSNHRAQHTQVVTAWALPFQEQGSLGWRWRRAHRPGTNPTSELCQSDYVGQRQLPDSPCNS